MRLTYSYCTAFLYGIPKAERTSSASCWLRPGRNPHEKPRKSSSQIWLRTVPTAFCTTLSSRAADLETKLLDFQHYFNAHRPHASLDGRLPEPDIGGSAAPLALGSYRWQKALWRVVPDAHRRMIMNSPPTGDPVAQLQFIDELFGLRI